MYKHILIPSDGTELSDKAIEAGVEFARESKAKVTGFTAVPEYQVPTEDEMMARRGVSLAQYEQDARLKAQRTLQRIIDRASAAGVEYEADYTLSDRPYEAIIRAAQKHRCDLIFMASHGRRGISALIHGSQTRDVLTHSTIPTLVYR